MYPELPGHNPNLPQYNYDINLANEILDEDGYIDTDNDGIRNDSEKGESFTFEISVPSDWISEIKVTRLIKEQLEDIGVNTIIKVLDHDTFYL